MLLGVVPGWSRRKAAWRTWAPGFTCTQHFAPNHSPAASHRCCGSGTCLPRPRRADQRPFIGITLIHFANSTFLGPSTCEVIRTRIVQWAVGFVLPTNTYRVYSFYCTTLNRWSRPRRVDRNSALSDCGVGLDLSDRFWLRFAKLSSSLAGPFSPAVPRPHRLVRRWRWCRRVRASAGFSWS